MWLDFGVFLSAPLNPRLKIFSKDWSWDQTESLYVSIFKVELVYTLFMIHFGFHVHNIVQ